MKTPRNEYVKKAEQENLRNATEPVGHAGQNRASKNRVPVVIWQQKSGTMCRPVGWSVGRPTSPTH